MAFFQSIVSGFKEKIFQIGTRNDPLPISDYSAQSFPDAKYKATITPFLYKPPFGRPLMKDIVNIRRLARTPYVTMVVNTICDEISSMEWDIIPAEDEEVPDEIIKMTKNWFYNPNRNDESFESIIRRLCRDILEIDAGVLVKVYNFKGEFVEIYPRDGGLFLMNPDIYGILPEFSAYYQYSWVVGSIPIAFDRNEIVYLMRNPLTDTTYGYSPVESLADTIQLLLYGIDSNLEYFQDNNQISKGVLFLTGATESEIRSFRESWRQQMRVKDSAGNWRRDFHKMPISNVEGKFERVSFSNLELELLEQQKWFVNLVFGCFGITKSEVGLIEDVNRATAVTEGAVFKRKTIRPLINLLEYHLNMQVLNELPWIAGKYEDKLFFRFVKHDLVEEQQKRNIVWGDLRARLITTNEARLQLDMEEIDGGDELMQTNPFSFGAGKENTAQFTKEQEEEKPEEKKEESKALITDNPLAPKYFEEMAKPKMLKKKFNEALGEIEKLIIAEMEKAKEFNVLSEIKAYDEKLIEKLMGFVSLTQLGEVVNNAIGAGYYIGMDEAEKKTGTNLNPNQKAIAFLQRYTLENLGDIDIETKNDIRQVLQRALIERQTPNQMKADLRKVLDSAGNRLEILAETELNRAQNVGSLDGYRQSGLEGKKQWMAIGDDRLCPRCTKLDGKAIPLNDMFESEGDEFDVPPAHSRCRCQISMLTAAGE